MSSEPTLKDFVDESVTLKGTFTPATDKADFTLIDRSSTSEGSPITVSFDLPFRSISQATLKTFLVSAESFGIGEFKNEFRLSSIIINGKRFEVSDPRNSVNLVDKLNDTDLNKVLKPFNNVLAVNFTAPLGAGFVLPPAEISAILTVVGERDPFSSANLPNTRQIEKKVGKIVDRLQGIGTLALVAVIVVAILLIVVTGRIPRIGSVD